MHEAHRDRGHPQKRPFHGRRGGPGICQILGEVGAPVDARQQQARRLGHQLVDPHQRAVGRRALDRVMPRAEGTVTDRIVHRDRMRSA